MTAQKTILVTGGASGIGLAIVQAILDQRRRVVVADVDPNRLDSARATLSQNHAPIHFEQMNVIDEEAVLKAMANYEAEIGPLTGLVNSAGIGEDVPCLDTTTALFRKIVEVNLIDSFVVAREAARCMCKRGTGSMSIVLRFRESAAMRDGSPTARGRPASSAMTQVMAVELASVGIRVNAIALRSVETPLVRTMHTQEARAAWMSIVPQRRHAAPSEIAGAAILLLDESKSSFVTGQTIRVDGGFTAAGLIGT